MLFFRNFFRETTRFESHYCLDLIFLLRTRVLRIHETLRWESFTLPRLTAVWHDWASSIYLRDIVLDEPRPECKQTLCWESSNALLIIVASPPAQPWRLQFSLNLCKNHHHHHLFRMNRNFKWIFDKKKFRFPSKIEIFVDWSSPDFTKDQKIVTLPSCSTLISIAFPETKYFIVTGRNLLSRKNIRARLTNERQRRWTWDLIDKLHHPGTLTVVFMYPYRY